MSRIHPHNTFEILQKHILVDALDIVIDLKKSGGSYIHDARSGKNYLDFFTFVASSPIGLNHPKMMTPEFREKLAYVAVNKPTNSDAFTVEYAEFVDAFSRLAMPDFMPHAFFIEGGALGVENALKAAFDWKIRKNESRGIGERRGKQVIHFERSFHGRSGYTLSLTNTEPRKTQLFPKFRWPRIISPALSFPTTDESVAQTIEKEQIALSQIDEALKKYPDDIAAIIIEPIQGEGGDNHFRKEFFIELRRIADEHEVMLIFDEVQTGVGLTGKMWAFEHFVKPDMIAFGKKMQVCGFLASRRIDEVPENVFRVPSRINSTWGGNLTDMVRAQRYLEIIREDNLIENARVVGEYLVEQLQTLQSEFPELVRNARGRGLFCALDLPTSEQRDQLKRLCFEKGILILGSGERSLRFRPPLTISREEIDIGIRSIREALGAMKG